MDNFIEHLTYEEVNTILHKMDKNWVLFPIYESEIKNAYSCEKHGDHYFDWGYMDKDRNCLVVIFYDGSCAWHKQMLISNYEIKIPAYNNEINESSNKKYTECMAIIFGEEYKKCNLERIKNLSDMDKTIKEIMNDKKNLTSDEFDNKYGNFDWGYDCD